MPELRTPAGRERLSSPPPPVTYESWRRNPAGAQRQRRMGRSARAALEVRNGLPFRPYVYRGLGYDQLTGDDDDA